MKELVYKGWIKEDHFSEPEFLRLDDENLAEILEDSISGKCVTVSYYTCNEKCTLDEARSSWLQTLQGGVETNVGARYSDITGYLWTDEEINVGGHDLIGELYSYVGKYLILLIKIHDIEK